MTAKKKKRAPEAQQLIDSLLDERTPGPKSETGQGPSRIGSEASTQKPMHQTFPNTPFLADDNSPDELEVTKTVVPDAADPRSKLSFDAVSLNASPTQSKTASEKSSASTTGRSVDQTVRLDNRNRKQKPPEPSDFSQVDRSRGTHEQEASKVDRMGITELKTVVKMRDRAPEEPRAQAKAQNVPGPSFGSAEAALKQSESLRIAQSRISELEAELERLRRENEQLATAGETLRRRSDELLTKTENYEIQSKESERIHDEEKKVFRGQIQQKERENLELRNRVEEMEGRLESNFKKIRVRERELEHRLEIVKMESATLVSTKDKMILDLKRQIDQITHESDYAKQKTQELFNQYKDKQETVRRVVRALRIALTILEGDEDGGGIKKAE